MVLGGLITRVPNTKCECTLIQYFYTVKGRKEIPSPLSNLSLHPLPSQKYFKMRGGGRAGEGALGELAPTLVP
jgi:hypothetical protein